MPKTGPHNEKRLSARFVASAPPGRHTDGGGLYLIVDQSGARRWMMRLTIRGTGRRREYGLGSARVVSLVEARKKAMEYRVLAAQGKDPVLERRWRADETMTFKKAAEQYHKDFVLDFGTNGKHKDQWINTLRTYAYPFLETVSVDDISAKHISAVLTPIWNTKRVTASRVKQRMKAVLDWSITNEYRRGDNPVNVVRMPSKKIQAKKFGTVSEAQLFELMDELRARTSIGAYALRFTILTAVRSANTRFAEWSEVGGRSLKWDAEGFNVWSIPGHKMKVQLEEDFKIRLPDEAVRILEEVSSLTPQSKYIFASPSNPAKPISDATMRKQLQEFFPEATVHGMRRAFRNWAEIFVPENMVRREAKEWCLAHANKNKTEERYLDETYYHERKYIMTIWGRYLNIEHDPEIQNLTYEQILEVQMKTEFEEIWDDKNIVSK